jgi:hypothetical protein
MKVCGGGIAKVERRGIESVGEQRSSSHAGSWKLQ